MSTATTLITADEFALMSFDHPVELIEGEIVEMTSPGGAHGRIAFRTAYLIERWLESKAHRDYLVMTNDPGVLLSRNPDTVRGPDAMVIREDRLPGGVVPIKHFNVVPDIAIEVKSPSDHWPEILHKVSQFLSAGVHEVWVIDPHHFRVHVYRVDDEPTIFNRGDTLRSACLPDFSCVVNDLFHGVISPDQAT